MSGESVCVGVKPWTATQLSEANGPPDASNTPHGKLNELSNSKAKIMKI